MGYCPSFFVLLFFYYIMARPKKNNADYFSHDNDMRNDDKILSVRRKFGHEWYSIWNMLLEKLCKSDWFIIDVDNVSLELLSWDFMIEPDKLSQIIDYFVYIKLIVKKDEKIYSQKLIDRFAWLLSKRKRDIDYRWQKQDEEVVIDVENPQSKVKESKVYNNKKEKPKKTNFIIEEETIKSKQDIIDLYTNEELLINEQITAKYKFVYEFAEWWYDKIPKNKKWVDAFTNKIAEKCIHAIGKIDRNHLRATLRKIKDREEDKSVKTTGYLSRFNNFLLPKK